MALSEKNGTLAERINRLVSLPEFPEKQFLDSGITHGDVHGMAGDIIERYGDHSLVCVATDNRAVMAASFLSALGGGPSLVLPGSNSPQVLLETFQGTGFTGAITGDTAVELPPNVSSIVPVVKKESMKIQRQPVDMDRAILTLFTGGSTGKPKIWSKTALNLMGEAYYLKETFGISEADRIAATVPPFHIYGFLFSVLLPLAASASVFGETLMFPGEIISTIQERYASVLVSIPMHYKALSNHTPWTQGLRRAFSSAGPLEKNDGMAFFEKTGVGIDEIYGSTETGGIAWRNRPTGEDTLMAFDGIHCKIKEDRLCVKSPFLSPELEREGDGYYRTGDRAQLKDGSITLLGRVDGIVKVGGRRVDLANVCEKIKSITAVTDACVFSRPLPGGRENEILAVVETPLDVASIMKALIPIMEPYALPRQVRVMEAIPLTDAGKYDRKLFLALFDLPRCRSLD